MFVELFASNRVSLCVNKDIGRPEIGPRDSKYKENTNISAVKHFTQGMDTVSLDTAGGAECLPLHELGFERI